MQKKDQLHENLYLFIFLSRFNNLNWFLINKRKNWVDDDIKKEFVIQNVLQMVTKYQSLL
jgi:hypothetical protein